MTCTVPENTDSVGVIIVNYTQLLSKLVAIYQLIFYTTLMDRFACCFFRCVAFDAPVEKFFAKQNGKKTDFKVSVFVIQE